jgi:hypothetical protein
LKKIKAVDGSPIVEQCRVEVARIENASFTITRIKRSGLIFVTSTATLRAKETELTLRHGIPIVVCG